MEQVNHKIGCTVFLTNSFKPYQLLKPPIVRTIRHSRIRHGTFYQLSKQQRSQNKQKQVNVSKLMLIKAKFFQRSLPIIPLLCPISFPSLKVLALNRDSITSLEGFSFLNMPVLEILWFRQNLITHTKPLNKTNWQNLKKIVFYSNKIREVNANRTKMNKQMQIILFDWNKDEIQLNDLRQTFKFEVDSVQITTTKSRNLINQKKTLRKIPQRFKNYLRFSPY